MFQNMLIRCGEPTKYDHSPYGTICKSVKMGSDKFEIYVQISENDGDPFWEMVGMFSSADTENMITDEIQKILSGRKMSSF